MTYCGSRPGFCGKKPDCADTHCPGRPIASQTHRVEWDALEEARKRGFVAPSYSDDFSSYGGQPLVNLEAEDDAYSRGCNWIAICAGIAIALGVFAFIDLMRPCPLFLPFVCN
jgi:hypothetical protein